MFKGEDKYVLIFYFIWHGDFMDPSIRSDKEAPRNISKIIRENDDWQDNSSLWGPKASYHYWAEPLFGFYDLRHDDYVIRKHAQMLVDCHADAIVIDFSNYMGDRGLGYSKEAFINILKVLNQILDEGGQVPKVSVLCTWGQEESKRAFETIYEDFYSDEKNDRLWFYYEGKPLVLVNSCLLSQEIKDRFTIRKPYPFYTKVDEEDAWPWLSIYPQEPAYTKTNPKELVAVSVSQNWTKSLDFMSATDKEGNFIARGRSYSKKGQKLLKNPTSLEYESKKGLNFQEQFDRAIEIDPTFIFVTGFNEWIAGRFLKIPAWARMSTGQVPPSGGFCDLFTSEFSRDIEPTREGELSDNFYRQLVTNIVKFKGIGKDNIIEEMTMPIDGSFAKWDKVGLTYLDDVNDAIDRKALAIDGKTIYENKSGRNDINLCKVSYDKDYIYFYVETVDPLSHIKGKNWMHLYISTQKKDKENWAGYQYLVNKDINEVFTSLSKSMGGFKWQTINDKINYKVSGNKLELALPLKDLGLEYGKEIAVDFKWFDNMQNDGDPLDFYLSGDAAPNAFFSYSFRTKKREVDND